MGDREGAEGSFGHSVSHGPAADRSEKWPVLQSLYNVNQRFRLKRRWCAHPTRPDIARIAEISVGIVQSRPAPVEATRALRSQSRLGFFKHLMRANRQAHSAPSAHLSCAPVGVG